MSVAIHKVIEVLSESKKSWEDAADRAVKRAYPGLFALIRTSSMSP